jgi:hypothetical protein
VAATNVLRGQHHRRRLGLDDDHGDAELDDSAESAEKTVKAAWGVRPDTAALQVATRAERHLLRTANALEAATAKMTERITPTVAKAGAYNPRGLPGATDNECIRCAHSDKTRLRLHPESNTRA